MKFWELVSVAGDDFDLLRRIASERDEWTVLRRWIGDFNALVNRQDRGILDAQVPEAYAAAVLRSVRGHCYLSTDGQLRSWRFHRGDGKMSYLEVFERFGGSVLEEVLEKGSLQVGPR